MVVIHKVWPGVLMGLVLGMSSMAPAAATSRDVAAIRCESHDGHFNRCPIPWRDAALKRQDSHGACIRGQSWGVDWRGLWVDHGCRGVFMAAGRDWHDREVRADYRGARERDDYRHDWRHRDDRDDRDRDGDWHPGRDWDREIRLDCHSNKNRYQMCQVDVGRHGHAQLIRQVSDARCSEGYSWGWNRAGVWVDHGCRGRFVVYRRW